MGYLRILVLFLSTVVFSRRIFISDGATVHIATLPNVSRKPLPLGMGMNGDAFDYQACLYSHKLYNVVHEVQEQQQRDLLLQVPCGLLPQVPPPRPGERHRRAAEGDRPRGRRRYAVRTHRDGGDAGSRPPAHRGRSAVRHPSVHQDGEGPLVEDLCIKGLVRTKLARSFADAAHGEFRRMLEYKSVWHRKHLIVIGRFFPSTKTCRACGRVNHALTLADREWACQICAVVHNRDLHAANNIKTEGLRILAVGHTESLNARGACIRPCVSGATGAEPRIPRL